MASVLYALLLTFATACTSSVNGQDNNSQPVRILFVGNSLSYSNDLPKLVEATAAKHDLKVETEIYAKPNYSLEDHWLEGNFQKRIAKGKFDFVIVQQGPSSQEDGKKMLTDYGRKIAKLCKRKNSKLAFFMVWPSRSNFRSFDKVIENYEFAAKQNDAILCPVGKIWKTYMEQTGDYSFFEADGFHPSLKGSESAAMIIFQSLFESLTSK